MSKVKHTLPHRRHLLAGLATLPAAAPALAGGNPDAELIEIGRQHAAVLAQMQAGDNLPEPEFEALSAQLVTLEREAMALPVATPSGLVVLATMVQQTALPPQSDEEVHDDAFIRTLVERVAAFAQAA